MPLLFATVTTRGCRDGYWRRVYANGVARGETLQFGHGRIQLHVERWGSVKMKVGWPL
jgi:hypothetical protein